MVVNAASGTNRDFLSYAANKGLLGAIHPKSHRLAMLRVNDVRESQSLYRYRLLDDVYIAKNIAAI